MRAIRKHYIDVQNFLRVLALGRLRQENDEFCNIFSHWMTPCLKNTHSKCVSYRDGIYCVTYLNLL